MELELLEILLNKVKILLESKNIIINNDELLIMYIQQAYNEACGICNTELQEDSFTNIAFLCMSDILSDSNDNKPIQSLSEGGRSVTFGGLTSQELRDKALKGLEKWKKVRCL